MVDISIRNKFSSSNRTSRLSGFIVFIFLLMFPSFLASAAHAKGRITVREKAEVSGTVILLGDVASFSGVTANEGKSLADLHIGTAPPPAREITLNRAQVKSRLYNAGIELSHYDLEIPDKVVIRSHAKVVTGKEIMDAAVEYLNGNLPGTVKNFTVSVKSYPEDVVLPTGGKVELRPVLDVRPERVGVYGFRVEVVQDGEVKRVVGVENRLELGMEVLVTTHEINAGDTFGEGDLKIEQRKISDLRSGALFSSDQVIGKRARRRLLAGDVIMANAVEVVPDINIGDEVQLVAIVGGVEVHTNGKAMEKGLRGDTIRVLNLGAKKIINGVIIDSKTVQVLANQ